MRDEGNTGGTRLGRIIFADDLREVINGSEIAGLALLEIAVHSRRQFEAPPLLTRIGHLDGYSLFDARNVDRSALQKNLYASRARIERAVGMAQRAGSGVISGSSGDARRGTVTMSESADWQNARRDTEYQGATPRAVPAVTRHSPPRNT